MNLMKYVKQREEEVKRMFSEHPYLVIHFDLDKTLSKDTCWTPDDCLQAMPDHEAIRACNELAQKHIVIIYTARKDDLIPASLYWLRANGIAFDGISNNKQASCLYVDDKCFNPKLAPYYEEKDEPYP